MTNPLRTPEDYEYYLYSLKDSSKIVKKSTLTFIKRGASLAKVTGELFLENKCRIVIRERIVFDRLPAVLDWYDSQPHPNDQKLQSTHPHHKHVPPNIKHNRIPASGLSFKKPNLDYLINEIEALIAKQ